MKTVYFDCFSGASGDMIVAGLIDAGASEAVVYETVKKLQLPVWDLHVETATKGAIRAARLDVASDPDDAHPRSYRDIVSLLQERELPDGVRKRALRVFELLAQAEAKIHGGDINEVHFHEVGSLDAIVDIVGACTALEELAPDRVVVSPIATGRGTTTSQHGVIPIPAPATLHLLDGAVLYERGDRELITPTGAALLAAWADAFGAMPPMKLGSIGYGAGSADLDWPNVLRVVVGDQQSGERPGVAAELLETNVDDLNPEIVPYVIDRLLHAGALDVWVTPAAMKKGRVGIVLSVLADPGDTAALTEIIFRETTTLGVRLVPTDRMILDRKEVEVTVAGHRVRVKVGLHAGQEINAAPEFEDAASVARATGMALKDVYRAALEALPEDRPDARKR